MEQLWTVFPNEKQLPITGKAMLIFNYIVDTLLLHVILLNNIKPHLAIVSMSLSLRDLLYTHWFNCHVRNIAINTRNDSTRSFIQPSDRFCRIDKASKSSAGTVKTIRSMLPWHIKVIWFCDYFKRWYLED